MSNSTVKTPWLQHYGHIPAHLDYPGISMVDLVARTAEQYPKLAALEFMGRTATYKKLMAGIEEAARALRAIGVQKGERVTICLPNVPQAVVLFYAVNRIGAISNMIHPLSSEGEIVHFIRESGSRVAITLDQFYPKFKAIEGQIELDTLLIASIADVLSPPKKLIYAATKGRKIAPIPLKDLAVHGGKVLLWKDFLRCGASFRGQVVEHTEGEYPAAILYSGGTSGTTKGILLSNLNFNALAMQVSAGSDCVGPRDTMLALMPVFHGFGLGICIHTMMAVGACSILIPQFTPKTYAGLLKKYRPNIIAGVPTLFEALLRIEGIDKLDLSCLKGVFSGGDSLSIELKRKVDAFLKQCGATIQVREGYGTTESVTASCLTPKDFHKEGSIGIPLPDCLFKIVTPSTHDEAPYGQMGEICMTGPTVMKEYVGNPRETAQTLQPHADGLTWLHTGDLGSMDEEGFIYFKQRLKRVIISSGYNIYPSQLENVIDSHEAVLMSTVIGVRDEIKMQKVKAFVVLRPEVQDTPEIRKAILEHCRKNIAKYAMPYEFEYRENLPRTLVGKVAYIELEKEEEEKRAEQGRQGD